MSSRILEKMPNKTTTPSRAARFASNQSSSSPAQTYLDLSFLASDYNGCLFLTELDVENVPGPTAAANLINLNTST